MDMGGQAAWCGGLTPGDRVVIFLLYRGEALVFFLTFCQVIHRWWVCEKETDENELTLASVRTGEIDMFDVRQALWHESFLRDGGRKRR